MQIHSPHLLVPLAVDSPCHLTAFLMQAYIVTCIHEASMDSWQRFRESAAAIHRESKVMHEKRRNKQALIKSVERIAFLRYQETAFFPAEHSKHIHLNSPI